MGLSSFALRVEERVEDFWAVFLAEKRRKQAAAEGEMRAAVEILGEMRARLWNERAARVRREVENLNTGRERP